jgi:hypothetical protein
MIAKLNEVLMWWEKVSDTPAARKFMKGWVYEVAGDGDYNAGRSAASTSRWSTSSIGA